MTATYELRIETADYYIFNHYVRGEEELASAKKMVSDEGSTLLSVRTLGWKELLEADENPDF